MSRFDRPDPDRYDAIAVHLCALLNEAIRDLDTRNAARRTRGDQPLPHSASLALEVDTEQRTYRGRAFRIFGDDDILTLYPEQVRVEPRQNSDTLPAAMIRLSTVTAVRLTEPVDARRHVDIPLSREALAEVAKGWIAAMKDCDPTNPTPEQADRMVTAATPLREAIREVRAFEAWERTVVEMARQRGVDPTGLRFVPDPDPTLDQVAGIDPFPVTTGMVLSGGIPLTFLYTETRDAAVRALSRALSRAKREAGQ